MKIRVRFFASLREAAGLESLEISDVGNFNELQAALRQQLPAAAMTALAAEHVRLALNQSLVAEFRSIRFTDGDEVAFLPPVTGG